MTIIKIFIILCSPVLLRGHNWMKGLIKNLFNKFRSYCKGSAINMSAKIESFMRNELKNK